LRIGLETRQGPFLSFFHIRVSFFHIRDFTDYLQRLIKYTFKVISISIIFILILSESCGRQVQT